MAIEFVADFTGVDPDAVDGGNVSRPGWYKAVVLDVGDDPKRDGVTLWTFKVLEGPFKGGLIYDRLYDPIMAEDTAKAEISTKRLAVYARRLGLWDGEQKKPRINWADALEQEVVLHLTSRKYKDRDGVEKETTNVEFAGIYPPDHPQIPHDAFAPGGGNPPPGKKPSGSARATSRTAAKEPAAPKADPYAGL